MGPGRGERRSKVWLAVPAALGIGAALVAADARARPLAANTILLAGGASLASVLLGAPLAFLLARTDVAARRGAAVLVLSLLFLPLYLQAAAWQAGFGLQGWFTTLAGQPPLLDGWRGAIAIHSLAAIPWVVLIVGVGLRLAEPELEEEALMDASPARVFRSVTLPRAAGAVGVAVVWVAVTTAGEMTVSDLFRIRTYAEQIYVEFALGDVLGSAPWRLAPSLAAAAWIIAAGLLLASRLAPADRHVSQRAVRMLKLGRWRRAASVATWGIVATLAGVPIASLVVKAGTIVTRHEQGLARHWSLEQCAAMVFGSPARFSREFGWSLLIGVLAATAATVVGLALAWNARRRGLPALPAWLAVALGLALPGPLVGVGLIACFNLPGWPWILDLYDHSIAVICLAQGLRALAPCTLVLWYAMSTIPSDLLYSATLEGATPLARFFRIALPERWPAVTVAWLVAFAVAWGELPASILVVPPGVITLPIQIFGLIHYGVDDRVAGVSLLIMAMFFALSVLLATIVRHVRRAAP